MKVVVTGATGNVGTALLRVLADDPGIDAVVGVARRLPDLRLPKVTWHAADVATDDLATVLDGATALVHLAWQIQPSWDRQRLHATNVVGSARVFAAAALAGVRAVVHASSVGVYSPAPGITVDEHAATHGVPTSSYSRHKAYVERLIDAQEAANPGTRWVRLRPALIFQRRAGAEVGRYFLGPLVPRGLFVAGRLPVLPAPQLAFQAVHAEDCAEAYRLALHAECGGAFNIAADGLLTVADAAELLGARWVRVPQRAARAVAAATWRARLQPTDPGWLDLAAAAPTMATDRARDTLGWAPRVSARTALEELLAGIAERAGDATPPLRAATN